jgi:phosphotransferase system IIB component
MLNRDVQIAGHQPVVPMPGGVYDINAPVNEKAYFKVRGIRQFNTDTAPAFGGVPTGMKAKYDLLVRADMDNERNKASPGKVYTIQQQDSVLIGEQILRRAAFREMQTYDDLVQQGLTHDEATKVVRDQMIAKAVMGKGSSTRAYHQQMKEIIHQMAAERGVQVGLPQSLATFAGRYAPNAHFATTGVGAVKAELRQKIHDPELVKINKSAEQLDVERVVQSAQGTLQIPDGPSLPPADMSPPPGYTLVQQHLRRVRGTGGLEPLPISF